MAAYFIVRAEVTDPADRQPFDRWYAEEHLRQALAAFRASRAWRGWSDADPSIHYAFYEFADLAAARAIVQSETLKRLIAEFDRAWGARVKRTRDVVEIAQAPSP